MSLFNNTLSYVRNPLDDRDEKIKDIKAAIASVETPQDFIESLGHKDPYSVPADEGRGYGKYQIQYKVWDKWSQRYFKTVPGKPVDIKNPFYQEQMIDKKLRDWYDQGISPTEMFALWNGASMVNGKIVPNKPEYVSKAMDTFIDSRRKRQEDFMIKSDPLHKTSLSILVNRIFNK